MQFFRAQILFLLILQTILTVEFSENEEKREGFPKYSCLETGLRLTPAAVNRPPANKLEHYYLRGKYNIFLLIKYYYIIML